jgi:hypothetical protein
MKKRDFRCSFTEMYNFFIYLSAKSLCKSNFLDDDILHCLLRVLSFYDIQGGSDFSGTTSELRRCIKNRFFILIILLKSVPSVCRNVNRNKQTH